MVGDPTGLETDLTPGKNLRPQCCSKKSPPGQLGVPARSSYIRGVARWAGWPAPVLPGRNVGEAWPGHECCGRLKRCSTWRPSGKHGPHARPLERGSKQWSSWPPLRRKRVFVGTKEQVLLFSPTSLCFDSCYSLASLTLPAKVYTGIGNMVS